MKELTPLKAIRKLCLRCANGSTKQVRECNQEDCPGWAFRMGKHPRMEGKVNSGSFIKTPGIYPGKI